MTTKRVLAALLLAGAAAAAAQESQAPTAQAPTAQAPTAQAPTAQAAAGEPKALAGMSILGNQETPKSLVIVPWKGSEIGAGIGVSRALDTRIRAVDKDVFMRELKYYSIRSGSEK
jgi:hypothetical protein